MKCRSVLAISSMCLLTLPALARAQAAEVTFVVPVNLSQLSPDLTDVVVRCDLVSAALAFHHSGVAKLIPVGGRVSATASVRVPIARLDVSAGATATYSCRLLGRKTGESDYRFLDDDSSDSTFRLHPVPPKLTGSFSWVEAPPTIAAPVSVTTTSPGGTP